MAGAGGGDCFTGGGWGYAGGNGSVAGIRPDGGATAGAAGVCGRVQRGVVGGRVIGIARSAGGGEADAQADTHTEHVFFCPSFSLPLTDTDVYTCIMYAHISKTFTSTLFLSLLLK